MRSTTTHKRKPLSKRLRFKVLNRDNFTCRYCGKSANTRELHIDHIIPFSEGGKTVYSNLITACIDCNLGKSNTIVVVPVNTRNPIEHYKSILGNEGIDINQLILNFQDFEKIERVNKADEIRNEIIKKESEFLNWLVATDINDLDLYLDLYDHDVKTEKFNKDYYVTRLSNKNMLIKSVESTKSVINYLKTKKTDCTDLEKYLNVYEEYVNLSCNNPDSEKIKHLRNELDDSVNMFWNKTKNSILFI